MNSAGLVLASLLLTRPGHCPGKQNVCPAQPSQPGPAQPSPILMGFRGGIYSHFNKDPCFLGHTVDISEVSVFPLSEYPRC